VSREPAAVFRSALDALSAHIAVLDARGRIVTANRAWMDAKVPAGVFTQNAKPGDSYLELCKRAVNAGQDGALVVQDCVTTVLEGVRKRSDAVYCAKGTEHALGNDDTAWFALRATRCEGLEPLHVVVTHEDITAEKRSLARERVLLEERAARSAAEAASQAKSEFLTTLSHELRTPLNAIAGYAQLLEMGVRGPVTLEQAEDLRRILRSERHLLGLINELLNFSRVERGDVKLDVEPVPLIALIGAVLELVEPQAASLKLMLSVHCDRDDIAALADPEKLRQILVNLLSNALKFTHAGGAIRVECDEDGSSVSIRVRDTGVGIPSSKLSEIFDPFVQVHRTLGAPVDGIGLGLAISRNLARAMHGDLTATSEIGRGSLFELRLPRAEALADVP
jgi:signal transduction histidine kinase